MKKYLIYIFVIISSNSFGQKPYKLFDSENEEFDTSRYSELCLLSSRVLPSGEIDWQLIREGTYTTMIEALFSDEYHADFNRRKNLVKGYLAENEITQICGSLDSSISTNSKGSKAKYFIIHDTSFPNYGDGDFPTNIDSASWEFNNLDDYFSTENGRSPLAHAFISRTGEILCQLDFSTPWRATKLELQKIDESVSKGLFLHIELVQPRKSDSTKWDGNDVIAPSPGFTQEQYKTLALLYLVASMRAEKWLTPGFHAVLDSGIKDGHDDPQNFDFYEFQSELNYLLQKMDQGPDRVRNFGIYQWQEPFFSDTIDLWATWYYVPTVESIPDGIPLLDEKEEPTGFCLDSCKWCDAVIEGTVLFKTDSGDVVLNYAGRSDSVLFDCRKCSGLENYSGYEKSGKVLFKESSGFGEGVNGYNLVPYRTIATDPEVIPFGTVVYIPEAKGTKFMRDEVSFVHDGYFFAGDTGSAIKGNHIDIFVGTDIKSPFDFVKSSSSGLFRVFIIDDSGIKLDMTNLHTAN